MTEDRLRTELRVSRALSVLSLMIAAAAWTGAGKAGAAASVAGRITAHRIDIVDRRGVPAMTITSHDDFPAPVVEGHTVKRRSGNDENGLVFYNQDGNEQGALLWDGRRRDGAVSANVLTFDSADSDQLLQVVDGTERGAHNAYVVGWDRLRYPEQRAYLAARAALPPDERAARMPIAAMERQRFFVGYGGDGTARLSLADGAGHVRAELYVQRDGASGLRFLDAAGREASRFPAAATP